MIKKILIGIGVTIGLASITVNILIFNQLYDVFLPDIRDSNKSILVGRLFGIDDSNLPRPTDNFVLANSIEEISFLSSIDSTINNLLHIQAELISVSGGVLAESGDLVNSSNKYYVNQYFFDSNYFRDNAINFFNQTLAQYLSAAKNLKYESVIQSKLELYEKNIEGAYFKDLTVAESLNFIELLKANIIIDKYIYLSGLNKIRASPTGTH